MIHPLDVLDRGIEPAAGLLSLITRRSRRSVPDQSPGDCVRARVASRLRSALLLRRLHRLNRQELDRFLELRVYFRGGTLFAAACATRRPLILATPHTETSVIACLVAARRLGPGRRFAILYQHEARNAGLGALIRSSGVQAELLSGFGGVVRALEILKQGGCIATMPDVYQALDDTFAVPFFGRWLRVAGGIPFLAHRSRAMIVPGYIRPVPGPRIQVDIGAILDAEAPASMDERQAVFLQTCRLFEQFERLIRRAPEHWVYLDRLTRLSTPMEVARTASAGDFVAAAADRCRQNPGLVRRAPELARLDNGEAP